MDHGTKRPRPLCLTIVDGWGLCEAGPGNACSVALTPVLSGLLRDYPSCRLRADGEAVGLESGQMGDSNVGHLNIGAGRIVYQDLARINRSVATGDIYRNEALLKAVSHVKRTGGRLHLMGLLSDGGVHSHINHLIAVLKLSKSEGVADVAVHCFMDGRDTSPTSGKGFIEHIESSIRESGVGSIATVMGRYYAMDRDKRWDRTKQAFDAIVSGEGHEVDSALNWIEESYAGGQTDEFILPGVIRGYQGILPGDAVIFFNFRADRARQISHALLDEAFEPFDRGGYMPVPVVGMAQYEEGLDMPVAFPPQYLKNTLGEVLSRKGLRQLRIAETEKYAHVTFFFNGMEEKPFEGEDRILIPSPRVATYDLKPEMSAPEVTGTVIGEVRSGKYDVIILNFANLDMVGHTGIMEAAVKAVETVDRCAGMVVDEVLKAGGATLICADHGNAEKMLECGGGPCTAHTSNPVPFILVDPSRRGARLRDGILADIAPTMLNMLGIEQPVEMDGKSLIVR
ncbi:MAG: 2,3-bisphosphoglycerate-independent phosphoglycerate mutase [Firmicutes bacterium]|nr:2,3-bisphosphoglycerate-independent phosphoglycerate mutase [Bacillota bacterium]